MKTYRMIGGLLITGLILTGCAETETKEKTEVKPVAEVTKPETTIKKESEAPVEEVEEVSNELEIMDYKETLSDGLVDVREALMDFATLNIQASEDTTLLASNDWMTSMAIALLQLEDGITLIQSIEVPEGYEAVHNELINGMEAYQFVVDNYPNAIDNMDLDLLDLCNAYLDDGNYYLAKAVNEMEKIQ